MKTNNKQHGATTPQQEFQNSNDTTKKIINMAQQRHNKHIKTATMLHKQKEQTQHISV